GKAFHAAGDLDVVGFVAPFVVRVLFGGHVRETADVALQGDSALGNFELERNGADTLDALAAVARGFVEACRTHPFLEQMVEIDVTGDHLLFLRETFGFGEESSIFVNEGVTIPREIGGGFARASGGIEIGGDAFAGLAGAEAAAILGFADGDVAGAQVQQNGRAGERSVGAGRNWRPNVFADFNVQLESFEVRRTEDHVV